MKAASVVPFLPVAVDNLQVEYITNVGLQDRICEMLERGWPAAGKVGCPVVVIDTEGPRAELIQLLVPKARGGTAYLFHNLPITKWLSNLMESRRVLKVTTRQCAQPISCYASLLARHEDVPLTYACRWVGG